MIEQKVLQNLGLSEKEAITYMALLQLGKSTVVSIAKTAGLKRPTVYVVLDELKKKGLVSEVPEKGRTLYSPEDPAVLEQNIKHSLDDFKDLLPMFRAQFSRGTKPTIKYYEDKDVIYNLYLNEIFPAKKIYFYGTSVKKINTTWPDMFRVWDSYWWSSKKKQPKNVLEIVGNEPDDIAYAKYYIGQREIRIIPKGKKFLADNAVADNKILITSFDPLFAVLIESPALADTYRVLVELAWESTIPAEEWKD